MIGGGRLRVLMTADTVGGVWTYALDLIEALRPLGVDVALATMGAPMTLAQSRAAAALGNCEVFESSFALEWMPEPWTDVDAAGDWLLALAALVRPQLVHINGFAHAALPFGAPVISVLHSCVCSWHRAVRGTDAGLEWSEYRRRAAAGLRAASASVAPTAAARTAILDALGVDVPCRVIWNGRATDARALPKESFVIAAGRLWDEAKGLADLEACAGVVRWPIRIAGPLSAPGAPSIARSTPPGAKLDYLGVLPPSTLGWWMGRAAIYAHPARYEPFGLAIVEAALSGCALVLSDLPSLREIWGDAAAYVPVGDRDALARTIDALSFDPLQRSVLAARAQKRAQSLTPARMASTYRALYDEVIQPAREVCA
jgi:glycogen(starch) synthase